MVYEYHVDGLELIGGAMSHHGRPSKQKLSSLRRPNAADISTIVLRGKLDSR